jgi:hypothetical protein
MGTGENLCWLVQLDIAAGGRVLFSVIGEDLILLWLWPDRVCLFKTSVWDSSLLTTSARGDIGRSLYDI